MLPVGSLQPNDFGLFDMLGNATSGVRIEASLFPTDSMLVEDYDHPITIRDNRSYILRGGAYDYLARFSRSAYRLFAYPDNAYASNGFRVARTIECLSP